MFAPHGFMSRALAAALLTLVVAPASAETTEAELWLERSEPEMTRALAERIEHATSMSLASLVVSQLLAASHGDDMRASAPPASPAQALLVESTRASSSETTMSCAATTASSFACVVHPDR